MGAEMWAFALTLFVGAVVCIIAILALVVWRKRRGQPAHDSCDDCVCDVCLQRKSASLLEILVRDWPEWIGGSRAYQDEDGDLIASNGYCFQVVVGTAEISSDRATAIVTEEKWRAARSLIK